jgi:S1-C subfamily serine protease
MNILDVTIVIAFALSVYWGVRRSIMRQAIISAGVIGALLATTFLYAKLAFLTEQSTIRVIVLLTLALAAGLLAYDILLTVGKRLQARFERKHHRMPLWHKLISGSIAGMTCITIAWAGVIIFSTTQVTLVRNQIDHSMLVSALSEKATAPTFLKQIAHLLEPFSSPQVFTGVEPTFSNMNSTMLSEEFDNLDKAAAKAQEAVVKINSWGCGSTTVGSGFVVKDSLIVTNAHVVAGANRISVQDQRGSYVAQPVGFDPKLDVAVLKPSSPINVAPLVFNSNSVSSGVVASILGYPGGKEFANNDAVILRSMNAVGFDIYGGGRISRQIYAFRGWVVPGNSGGPLIDTSGKVIGLVFGNSTAQERTGYAITSDQVEAIVSQAATQTRTVANGSCAG